MGCVQAGIWLEEISEYEWNVIYIVSLEDVLDDVRKIIEICLAARLFVMSWLSYDWKADLLESTLGQAVTDELMELQSTTQTFDQV